MSAESIITDQDIDEALQVAEEQADVADDEVYSAAFRRGAEFIHRYLTERDRLRDDTR